MRGDDEVTGCVERQRDRQGEDASWLALLRQTQTQTQRQRRELAIMGRREGPTQQLSEAAHWSGGPEAGGGSLVGAVSTKK